MSGSTLAPRRFTVARKYGAVAALAVRQRLEERFVLAARALLLIVYVLIFSRLWQALLPASAGAGRGAPEYIWYFAIAEWVMLAQPQFYVEIEGDVRSGEIAYRLGLPISYLGAKLAGAAGELALNLVVLGVVAALTAYGLAGGLPDPRGLWLALPIALLSSALFALTHALIGLSAFWLVDCTPLYWIWQKIAFLLGGLMVPLDLYPGWLRTLALAAPVSAQLYGPGSMAFGFEPARALATSLKLALWIAALAALLVLVHRRGLRALEIHGG